VAAIGPFATRRVLIPVEMAIMLAYTEISGRVIGRGQDTRHGQLDAGKMVDQSAEITSVFPYLVLDFEDYLLEQTLRS
jgi:hypothetical protein